MLHSARALPFASRLPDNGNCHAVWWVLLGSMVAAQPPSASTLAWLAESEHFQLDGILCWCLTAKVTPQKHPHPPLHPSGGLSCQYPLRLSSSYRWICSYIGRSASL